MSVTRLNTSTSTQASVSASLPGFTSFKTTEAIRYPRRWHRDALIQATLDPTITSIAPSPVRTIKLPPQVTFAFIAVHQSAPVLVGLAEKPVPEAQGTIVDCLPLVVFSRQQVLSEPRMSTARMIWSTRQVQVSPGDRIRILRKLSAASEGLPLSTLEDLIQTPDVDPYDAILSMVCLGILALDVDGHLTPETLIRRQIPAPNARPPNTEDP